MQRRMVSEIGVSARRRERGRPDVPYPPSVNQLMASLITTREVLARIPTWPWETGTLAGFVSVFLLPFIVGMIIELLERFLF